MQRNPMTSSRATSAAVASASIAMREPAPIPRDLPANHGVFSTALDRLQERYRAGVEAAEIPGAVVLVARHGHLIYEGVFGFADRAAGTAMTADTVFALASMTKPITTVAAMILVEEGRLCLGEPIARYLPEFANLEVVIERPQADGSFSVASEPANSVPTVQDLMRHTSGFVYGAFGDSELDKSYLRTRVLDRDVPLSEMMARLAKLPLAHQPGTTFEYSVSTDVLGRIVEVASGETLDRYIARTITGPLNMIATAFCVSSESRFAWPDGLNPAQRQSLEARLHETPAGLSGGGGMYGTANDYLRFAEMLRRRGELDGVRILAPKSVQLMTSNQLAPSVKIAPNSASLLRLMAPTPEMGQGFGLGFAVRLTLGHNPAPGSVGDFHWAGASGTHFWVDPTEELAVVVLTAQPQPNMKVLYRHLNRQLVYQALEEVSSPRGKQRCEAARSEKVRHS